MAATLDFMRITMTILIFFDEKCSGSGRLVKCPYPGLNKGLPSDGLFGQARHNIHFSKNYNNVVWDKFLGLHSDHLNRGRGGIAVLPIPNYVIF